jgi:ABC-type transport system substrate-binding protein
MTGFYNAEFGKQKEGQYYDLNLAKDFLKKSRYANGVEVSLLSTNAGVNPRQAEVIQAQLAKLGIKVNISLQDVPTFRKRWLEEKQWDIVQVQWDADLDPDETLFPRIAFQGDLERRTLEQPGVRSPRRVGTSRSGSEETQTVL